MKKRLLITSVVMMLVVAVALGTSTYAWFTSNASVTTSPMTLKAEVSGASSLGIGWLDGEAGTSIEATSYEILRPMAPDSLTKSSTTSDVIFRSATIKEEGSQEKFNADMVESYHLSLDTEVNGEKTYYTKSGGYYTAVASPVKADLGSYYEKSFAPIVYNNGTKQAFYVKNLSHTNNVGTITVSAEFTDNNAYVLTQDATFQLGTKYYTSVSTTPVEITVVSESAGENQVLAGAAVTDNTYYEKITANDLIRVAIFTKAPSTGTSTATNYTLLGVLGQTATDYVLVSGSDTYSKNKTYYVKSGESAPYTYTPTAITDDTFADAKSAGTLYTATNTAAYGGSGLFDLNDAVKDLNHYQEVKTSLTLTTILAHDQQIDIVAIAWMDGTELTDARAGQLGQVSLKFTAA